MKIETRINVVRKNKEKLVLIAIPVILNPSFINKILPVIFKTRHIRKNIINFFSLFVAIKKLAPVLIRHVKKQPISSICPESNPGLYFDNILLYINGAINIKPPINTGKIILNIFEGKIYIVDRVEGDYTRGSNFIILLPEVI